MSAIVNELNTYPQQPFYLVPQQFIPDQQPQQQPQHSQLPFVIYPQQPIAQNPQQGYYLIPIPSNTTEPIVTDPQTPQSESFKDRFAFWMCYLLLFSCSVVTITLFCLRIVLLPVIIPITTLGVVCTICEISIVHTKIQRYRPHAIISIIVFVLSYVSVIALFC